MSLAVIVQMRLDSSRLPRKALLPLGFGTVASAVLERLRHIPADHYILACDPASQPELAAIATAAGFRLHVGPKDDVLGRFCGAIETWRPTYIVRATGDNPFVSAELATRLLDYARPLGLDYAGYQGLPLGMGVEVVKAAALLVANRSAASLYDREHVCPYLYQHPDLFQIERPACPAAWQLPASRLTIDTAADYALAQQLVAALGEQPTDASILAWLKAGLGSGS
ncbi:MAG: hypothetical protein A2Y35_10385 [Spirochaetes bacterium GWE1_60_18]|nr:MAG: hypothetical protein A2Y35_10385 [Spirochaetes bacterium GWE1_60_18]